MLPLQKENPELWGGWIKEISQIIIAGKYIVFISSLVWVVVLVHPDFLRNVVEKCVISYTHVGITSIGNIIADG